MVASTSDATRFRLEGYIGVEEFLAPEVCQLASRYALMKQQIEPGRVDTQVPRFAYSVYGDTLMESLAETVWHRIESIIDEPLWPTYTYYRVYETGAVFRAAHGPGLMRDERLHLLGSRWWRRCPRWLQLALVGKILNGRGPIVPYVTR